MITAIKPRGQNTSWPGLGMDV